MTYAVIPAKSFQGAKQRLAAVLQPHERFALARATLTDTLTACMQASGLVGVGVVTCDDEVAAVLTYVRNAFGNQASAVTPEDVKQIRAAVKNKKDFYSSTELLNAHPLEK